MLQWALVWSFYFKDITTFLLFIVYDYLFEMHTVCKHLDKWIHVYNTAYFFVFFFPCFLIITIFLICLLFPPGSLSPLTIFHSSNFGIPKISTLSLPFFLLFLFHYNYFYGHTVTHHCILWTFPLPFVIYQCLGYFKLFYST